jgi:hypothetical protein
VQVVATRPGHDGETVEHARPRPALRRAVEAGGQLRQGLAERRGEGHGAAGDAVGIQSTQQRPRHIALVEPVAHIGLVQRAACFLGQLHPGLMRRFHRGEEVAQGRPHRTGCRRGVGRRRFHQRRKTAARHQRADDLIDLGRRMGRSIENPIHLRHHPAGQVDCGMTAQIGDDDQRTAARPAAQGLLDAHGQRNLGERTRRRCQQPRADEPHRKPAQDSGKRGGKIRPTAGCKHRFRSPGENGGRVARRAVLARSEYQRSRRDGSRSSLVRPQKKGGQRPPREGKELPAGQFVTGVA